MLLRFSRVDNNSRDVVNEPRNTRKTRKGISRDLVKIVPCIPLAYPLVTLVLLFNPHFPLLLGYCIIYRRIKCNERIGELRVNCQTGDFAYFGCEFRGDGVFRTGIGRA